MRVEFFTQEGKEQIIQEKLQIGYVLVEEQNLFEGNFLIFQKLSIEDDEFVDEEKIAMAEAIVDLNSRLTQMEVNLQGGSVNA